MPPARRTRAFRFAWFLAELTWAFIYNILDTVVCQYIVYQDEICPRTGRRHVQGYVYFANGKTLERVRAIFQGAGVKTCQRSPAENKAYCTKLESRREGGRARERGELPDQGARSDIHDARKDIENGMDDFDMFVKYGILWARYGQVLIRHRSAMVKPRDFWTITLTLWGKTGIGKSARARWTAQQNGGNIATMMLPRNQDSMVWCDGCIDARTIIIEDMELPGNFSYGVLKNMLDWTPCLMPVKCMSMQWAPHFVIITSNYHPREWYPDKDGAWNNDENALCRRLTTNGSTIVHMERRWRVPQPRLARPGSPMLAIEPVIPENVD